MFSRLARTLVPPALLIAFVAMVASAPAHEKDRIPPAQLGDPQQGGLPPDYIFFVDESSYAGNYVLDAIANDGPSLKDVMSNEGVSSEVQCGLGNNEKWRPSPAFEFSPDSMKNWREYGGYQPYPSYAVPCKVAAKVTMKEGVAKLLGFRGTSFDLEASPNPVDPTFNGDPHNAVGYGPRSSHFHFTLPRDVRKKLKPVMWIDKLAFSAVVTGPASHGSPKVAVKPERAYWIQNGKSCVTKDRNLYVRPRDSAPRCPKNKDGAYIPAPVNWYKGG